MVTLDTVWFYVRSLDASRAFYEAALGLKIALLDRHSGWLEFDTGNGGCRFACQEWGKTPESAEDQWPNTRHVVPKVVFATEDLATVSRHIRNCGSVASAPQEVGNVRFINAQDLDGNSFQIVEKRAALA